MPLFTVVPCEQDNFVSIEGYARAQWKKTIALAVGIHLIVLILMLLPASLFEFRHNREEIYTVNLFEAREAAPARKEAPPPAAVQKKEVVQPPPPVVKKVEAPPVKQPEVVEKIEPVPPAEPVVSTSGEVVSLKPRLVKKEVKPKTVEKKVDKNEEIKVDQAVNRIKNELARKQAEKKARQMQAEAAAAVDDAVAQIRDSIRAQRLSSTTSAQPAAAAGTASGGSGGGAGGGSDAKLDAALKLYYVAVSQQIHEHWVLPEMQDWKKDLKAVVVVQVRNDGVVTKYEFEQKSDNIFFNQFVEKTLKESLPLPPFPADLDESSLEIGLVFHPSGLQ
ncbi:MAG: TonB C-terminal domain-containing protein [Deltaproteobacteria bacterium]|nr:TonB C-terminal domain-containing protein [Deltaproteobacteria bacterium]